MLNYPNKRVMNFESICARDFHNTAENEIKSHTLPIYESSTFIYENAKKAMDVFDEKADSYIYSRWSNPTIVAVEEKLAALETYGLKTEVGQPLQAKTLIFSSGMAAISALFCSNLNPGDKVLTTGNIYGSTVELLQVPLTNWGIKPVFADLHDLDKVERILSSDNSIKLIYIESPTNPTIECYDLEKLAALAKKHNAKIAVDNTFCTPFLQQPFKFGADFVLHSTTKFLNGHGTSLGGAYIGLDIDFMNKKAWQMRKLFGGNSNAMEAWLLNLGLKTLPLRMEKHCANAMEIAGFLEKHPKISKVNYCGLESHSDHETAKKQMRFFGGIVSFEIKGGLEQGIQFMDRIKFCTLTSTLGTPDTLITHPASMTHVKVPKEQREKFGINDNLIRMAVGIENVSDIIEDIEQALKF